MDKKWKLRLPWKCRKWKRPRYDSKTVCALTSPILFSIMHMCFVDQENTKDDMFQSANATLEGVMVDNLTPHQTWHEIIINSLVIASE